MMTVPFVTVLIPARNEARDIERCLQAVLAQDHPHEYMEIVLVDGGSDDSTAQVATDILSRGDVRWKLIDNPMGTTPSNLNAGLAAATGEILCRVDARSFVPPEYVRLCAEVLTQRPDIAVTGGTQASIAVSRSVRSIGIARALNNPLAMGGSPYRSGAPSGPTDTVYLGAFRTGELRSVGGWDEFFETNQDFELNRRMRTLGVVWFDDRLEVGYSPRQSLGALWRQYHRFGRWKVRYWRRTGERPRRRQIAPLALTPVAVAGALLLVRRRRVADGAVATAAICGAALLLDTVGGPAPRPPIPARIVAATANSLVVLGWTVGVWRELIFGGTARD